MDNDTKYRSNVKKFIAGYQLAGGKNAYLNSNQAKRFVNNTLQFINSKQAVLAGAAAGGANGNGANHNQTSAIAEAAASNNLKRIQENPLLESHAKIAGANAVHANGLINGNSETQSSETAANNYINNWTNRNKLVNAANKLNNANPLKAKIQKYIRIINKAQSMNSINELNAWKQKFLNKKDSKHRQIINKRIAQLEK